MDRRNDAPVRDKVETIKGDTHAVLDEAKAHVKAAGERAARAVDRDAMPAGDRPERDVREEGI